MLLTPSSPSVGCKLCLKIREIPLDVVHCFMFVHFQELVYCHFDDVVWICTVFRESVSEVL